MLAAAAIGLAALAANNSAPGLPPLAPSKEPPMFDYAFDEWGRGPIGNIGRTRLLKSRRNNLERAEHPTAPWATVPSAPHTGGGGRQHAPPHVMGSTARAPPAHEMFNADIPLTGYSGNGYANNRWARGHSNDVFLAEYFVLSPEEANTGFEVYRRGNLMGPNHDEQYIYRPGTYSTVGTYMDDEGNPILIRDPPGMGKPLEWKGAQVPPTWFKTW